MNCEEYRQLYPRHTDHPVPREIWDSPEGEAWSEHRSDCDECTAWYLGRRVEKAGFKVEDFPCLDIAMQLLEDCNQHPCPWMCSDQQVVYSGKWHEYYLVVRAIVHERRTISHCPWCGISLTPLRVPWPELPREDLYIRRRNCLSHVSTRPSVFKAKGVLASRAGEPPDVARL